MRTVSCYRPGPRFPSISLTGARCELGCPHCAGRPLAAMLPAETPARLCELADRLADDGALGFLMSGGCSADGVLHLDGYLEAIRSIKETTDLRINAHVGLPREEEAARIARSGIDSFSITYPMSDRIGREALLIDDAVARYKETSSALRGAGAKVIPHALLGLGDREEDARGMEALAEDPPQSLIVIAFMPLRGTPFGSREPPAESRMVESMERARELMPRTKLVLGCMRPKGRAEMEAALIERILDGIATPSARAERSLTGKVLLEKVEGCCAIHL